VPQTLLPRRKQGRFLFAWAKGRAESKRVASMQLAGSGCAGVGWHIGVLSASHLRCTCWGRQCAKGSLRISLHQATNLQGISGRRQRQWRPCDLKLTSLKVATSQNAWLIRYAVGAPAASAPQRRSSHLPLVLLPANLPDCAAAQPQSTHLAM